MTREEATAQLELTKQAFICNYADKYISEALDMAIRSLEAWDKVKTELKAEKKKYSACGLIGSASGVSRSIEIIDKHLSEVEK